MVVVEVVEATTEAVVGVEVLLWTTLVDRRPLLLPAMKKRRVELPQQKQESQ